MANHITRWIHDNDTLSFHGHTVSDDPDQRIGYDSESPLRFINIFSTLKTHNITVSHSWVTDGRMKENPNTLFESVQTHGEGLLRFPGGTITHHRYGYPMGSRQISIRLFFSTV